MMRATNNNSLMVGGNESIRSVNETSYLFAEYVCREYEKIGMRFSYRYILQPLMENKSLTQLELVNITGQKPPTISITLRNMERDGIVSRDKNDDDRRETHVALTDKGKKMYAKVVEILDKAQEVMLSGLSDKELKSMRTSLGKMSTNLKNSMK